MMSELDNLTPEQLEALKQRVIKRKEVQSKYYEAHKVEIAECTRKYYEAHKDERAEYYEAHEAEKAECARKYYEAHREEKAEYMRKYGEAHKDERAEYDRKYNQEHPEVRRQATRRRRVRKMGADGHHSFDEWFCLCELHGFICVYCGYPTEETLHEDHATPLSRGGSDGIDNILPACGSCNSSKCAKTFDEFLETMSEEQRKEVHLRIHIADNGIREKYEGVLSDV